MSYYGIPLNKFYGNTLELHYWFEDNSHTMDAFIENKCGYEILGIIKEIANIYSLKIQIETEPIAEGGLRKWLKIATKGENKNATITSAIIIALVTVILTTPLAKITEKLIDKLFEDTELLDLEKEKLKLEIDKLKKEAQEKNLSIENNNLIKRKRSNFYETLEHYPKIEKISFITTNEYKNNLDEKTIEKIEFKNFILVNDDLEPIKKDRAIIEIISPVLKKGKYKWIGYYNGEIVSFYMKSNEFKTLVQNGEVEFKNGSSIDCSLEIRKKIDNEGLEKITGYDVVRVNHYFQNNKPVETKEGKKHREIADAQKNQISLFDIENKNSTD